MLLCLPVRVTGGNPIADIRPARPGTIDDHPAP
jgi:hypothetical protein